MDKDLTTRMKVQARMTFVEFMAYKDKNGFLSHEGASVMMQAIQAYAALCQAEAMELMAGCRICGSQSNTHDDAQHERYARETKKMYAADLANDANNRGDQSIADAISEQVTDPADEPWAGSVEEVSVRCRICGNGHPTDDAAAECARTHV